MENMLEIDQLNYSYHTPEGETAVLDRISFSIKSGEFLSIVGPSGCGKSTLLSLICGLIQPEEGSVFLKGKNTGYMLQKDQLLEWRSIYKNVILGLEIQHKLSPEMKKKAHDLLNLYGLHDFANSKPSELSGGMRQRAALIRTLMSDPDLLLLDEPFSALDYQTRLNVNDDIGQIIKKENKTAILVTHDLSEAISLGDKVIILSKRPSTIKQTVFLEFPEKENTPLKRRNTPEFKEYFNLIWKEMNKND